MNLIAGLIGLPLHPLLVHAVVVLLPLEVFALLLVQFWPRTRRCLQLPVLLGSVLVAALVPVTIIAGEALAARVGALPSVAVHEAYGRMLVPWTIGLVLIAVIQSVWFRWARDLLTGAGGTRPAKLGSPTVTALGIGLAAGAVVVALGALTVLVLTGDSGARSVWSGYASAM